LITLNSEKGLIHVENWDEIESRPGFEKNLNPVDHELESIIGRYLFKHKIKCGLSNCHTPHAKGYIVVTKDGRETNIGKDCGKTYFGVDFETLSKKFERDITESENRERLWSFSFKLEELERRITELRKTDRGADWVHKNIRPLITLNAGCPEVVVRRIASMIKTRSDILSIEREATQAEIENREALENRRLPRPYYIDEPIAEIEGIEALYPENDLRTLLVLELEVKMKEFQEKDIDTLTYQELGYWVKWANSVDSTIEQAIQAVTYGRNLLDTTNLEPFFRILPRQTESNSFRAYLKKLGET
jgi:hypothetical protein